MDITVQTTDIQVTAATMAVTAATVAAPSIVEEVTLMSAPEKDLQQIRAAIDQLKTAGEQLFADEIAGLEAKATALEEKLKNDLQEAETEAKGFIEKYGGKILRGVEDIAIAFILIKVAGLI